MQRRAFVRLLGGGVIAAAAVPMAGCDRGLPPDALAAWQVAAAETDLRRWILAHAILAPHSHNLQSWLVELRGADEILLRCDLDRLLPETDPFHRQMMMSQGTFIELLDLAARERGQRAEVTLFPEGAPPPERLDQRPVAHIRLHADASVPRDPLFAQILLRRTHRNAYELQRPVPPAAWQAMAEAARSPGLRFGHAGPDRPELLRQQRAIALQAWRIELVTPRTMLESLKVLRIGQAEISRHRDGISLTDPKVVWLDRLGLFDRSRAPGPDDFAVTSQVTDFRDKLDSTPGFLWMVSDSNERPAQVQAGRAYARVQLAGTAQGVVMQPLQQALQEYAEQAQAHAAIRHLLGVPPGPQTVQMWARVGFAAPVPPAPRRGLDAHLRAA